MKIVLISVSILLFGQNVSRLLSTYKEIKHSIKEARDHIETHGGIRYLYTTSGILLILSVAYLYAAYVAGAISLWLMYALVIKQAVCECAEHLYLMDMRAYGKVDFHVGKIDTTVAAAVTLWIAGALLFK
ncbi:MAG: hypothetical protein ACOC4C_05785 [Fibrobacterota bacterium]